MTPSPILSTTPAPSCPSTVGEYPDGSAPEAVYRSVWQTPQATSRTRTSPAFASARSSSWTSSGRPNSSSTAARIFTARSYAPRAGSSVVRADDAHAERKHDRGGDHDDEVA